jgi:acyl-coenzyme A thioesterase PaaI-like protein
MGRPITTEYTLGRKIMTGIADPTGLRLVFEHDGNRVYCHIDANEALCGKAKVVPPGVVQGVADDLAHAAVATLKKRIGVTRESRLRFLKPLYTGEHVRADGTVFKETHDVVTVSVRLVNKRDQLCVEGEVEVFGLTAEQVRRVTADGMVPAELRRFLP